MMKSDESHEPTDGLCDYQGTHEITRECEDVHERALLDAELAKYALDGDRGTPWRVAVSPIALMPQPDPANGE